MLKLSDLNVCSKDDFVAALANVFELSPWVAGQVVALRPFAGIGALLAAMAAAVDRAPDELRLALIRAHPDLAKDDVDWSALPGGRPSRPRRGADALSRLRAKA